MNKLLNNFKNQKIAVIGDLIVDEYRDCYALGKSAESPTIVVKEREITRYIGGAGIIARHIKALGGNPLFLSVCGNDDLGHDCFEGLKVEGINSVIIFSDDRETTLKIRYISDNHKLLRVSHLTEKEIGQRQERELFNRLQESHKDIKINGIIISDFNYGVISKKLLKDIKQFAEKNKIKLFGDSQTSSQYGDIKKLHNYHLITPNGIEARRALGDNYSSDKDVMLKLIEKLKVKNIYMTLGREGVIGCNGDHYIKYPAFNKNPVDVMGAGDAMLACSALAICAGADLKQAVYLGSVMSGIKVGIKGNTPIGIDQLQEGIKTWNI